MGDITNGGASPSKRSAEIHLNNAANTLKETQIAAPDSLQKRKVKGCMEAGEMRSVDVRER